MTNPASELARKRLEDNMETEKEFLYRDYGAQDLVHFAAKYDEMIRTLESISTLAAYTTHGKDALERIAQLANVGIRRARGHD